MAFLVPNPGQEPLRISVDEADNYRPDGRQRQPLSITPTQSTPVVDQAVADERAAKAHFGLGEKSPGLDVLRAGIASGREDQLRRTSANKAAMEFRQQKLNMLNEIAQAAEGPLSPEEQDFILGMSQVDFTENLDTIWETEYGQQFVNTLLASSESDDVRLAMQEDPDAAMDAADASTYVFARREIARKIAEDVQAEIKNQGWVEYGQDVIGDIIPILPWYRMSSAIKEAPTTSILPGNNMEEQLAYLWALPPSEFRQQLKAAVDDIGQSNKQTALFFAQMALSFSHSDQFTNNVWGLVDAADVATLGVAGLAVDGVRAGVRRGLQGAATSIVEGDARGLIRAAARGDYDPVNASRIERFRKAMRDVIAGTRSGRMDPAEVLEAAGRVEPAARLNAVEQLRSAMRANDPLLDSARLKGELPSIFNPERIVGTGSRRLSQEFTDRLTQTLMRNADNVIKAITSVSRVDRMTPEALDVAFAQAEAEIRRRFTHINDAVLDVVRYTPEEMATNTGAVEFRLGNPNGSLFTSANEADAWARGQFRLDPTQYKIIQQGEGFYVSVAKDIDETTPEVRNLMVTTGNRTDDGMVNQFLGFLRSPEDYLGQLQRSNRHAATHGMTEIQRLMKEIAEDIGSLSKREKTNMQRVFERNRDYVDPETGQRGMFYDTVEQLENAYFKMHNAFPTEKEIRAYFAYRQLNDFDYVVRNLGLYRDKSRQGIESVRYRYSRVNDKGERVDDETIPFDGKRVDEIPWSNPEEAYIWVEDIEQLVRKNGLTDESRAHIDSLLERGYQIVQVANPSGKPLKYRTGSEQTVHFVVVKNPVFSRLKWDQLPYRPGGHVEYASEWYVKQPRITRILGRDGTVVEHIYEGDSAILGFRTQAEAQKWAKLMDDARLLLREGRTDDLKKFLTDNSMPYSYKDFKALFEPRFVMRNGEEVEEAPLLNIDDKISFTRRGRNVSDMDADLPNRYANFRNDVRSTYNLYNNIDKKFAGERDGPLKTVTEEVGTEHNPITRLTMAPMIDPYASLERTTANVIRNRLLSDYKISAVESWVQEFGDLLTQSKTREGRASLAHDPVLALHSPEYVAADGANTARLAAAENARQAVLNLLGTPNAVQEKVEYMRGKVMDTIYNSRGQKAVEMVPEWALAREADPARAMRAFAFHTKLGLFNWQQFFVNAQSLTHVLAVAGPANAIPSMAAATLMSFARINAKPQILEKMATIAGNMGYNKRWFHESFEHLRKSGYYNIEGETAWKDVIDYRITESKLGKFLDWGTTPFKESERLLRLSAWNASFMEFRKANPSKVIGNRERNAILQRAQTLSVNMTRASNANWQNGAWSIPTQFWSYQLRLTEQLVGKRLTPAEKRRAFLTYGLMYGIPATGAAFTMIPLYDKFRTDALQRGWNLDDFWVKSFHEGMVSAVMSEITGKEWNAADRYGPGGLPIFEPLEGENTAEIMMELMLGASGSIAYDTLATFDPFMKYVTGIFRDDQREFPLRATDFIEPLQNVSSVNNSIKAIWALNTGRYITKNEVYLGDIEGADAIFAAITGLTPLELNDAFLMNNSLRKQADAQRAAETQVIKNLRRAYQELANDNMESFEEYMQRARVFLIAGGFQPDQWSKIFNESVGGNTSLVEEARRRFIERAPVRQYDARMNALMRENENQ